MSAMILDGKTLAAQVRSEVAAKVTTFQKSWQRRPGLHVVLAGDDPASAVYVRNKEKAAEEIGVAGVVHRLPSDVSQAALLDVVRTLGRDEAVDGILVQLPLPKHIQSELVLEAVDPRKDVDGFHPVNAGLLASGRPGLVPCTPLGCMRLIDEATRLLGDNGQRFSLDGARAVVVGRSNIVGKPMAQLLLAANATVTIAHSRTHDLPSVCRTAQVLVVAIGRAEAIGAEHVGEGAIVIDVGMNRVVDRTGKSRLVGDVAFQAASERAAAITPVPGGVGPMTIALLLQNTIDAGNRRMSAAAGV